MIRIQKELAAQVGKPKREMPLLEVRPEILEIADRVAGLIIWKLLYVTLRGLVTGWLLASWVCLFRQCETGRINQETWIAY